MSLKTGTLSIEDLLANKFQSVADFGENTIAEILARDLATHRTILTQLMSEFCDITTDRQRIMGTSQTGEMIEADEFSRGPTQKETPGQTVGFPYKRYQYAIGWTRDWMLRKTPSDMAIAQQTSQRAEVRRAIYELKKAFFNPTNYTHVDMLVDNVSFPVKALINADSTAIPDGPNGEQFDGTTHTHYLASATLTTAAVDGAITTVVEHGHGQDVRIYINRANEAAFRALTGFLPFYDPTINKADTTDTTDTTLDISRLDNRAIGRYNGATIWVKPWMIANYAWVVSVGSPAKPFVFRQNQNTALQGLRIAGENDAFPLRAQYMQSEFGIGVWNRTNGAVLQFNNGTYQVPTIVM